VNLPLRTKLALYLVAGVLMAICWLYRRVVMGEEEP
jgi:hypothetical protein